MQVYLRLRACVCFHVRVCARVHACVSEVRSVHATECTEKDPQIMNRIHFLVTETE